MNRRLRASATRKNGISSCEFGQTAPTQQKLVRWAAGVFVWACHTAALAQAEPASAPAANSARPAPASDAARAAAERQFRAGLSLQKVDDFGAAIDAYRASIRLYPTKSALFNLANCLRATHNYPEALDALEQLESTYGSELDEPMKSTVLSQLHELQALTALVRIEVEHEGEVLAGASIIIDGVPVARSPMSAPVRVALGEHTLDVSLEGYQRFSKRLNLLSGQQATESVELLAVALPAAPPPSPPPLAAPPAQAPASPKLTPPVSQESEHSSGLRSAGWSLASGGSLLLIGGAVAGTWALSLDSDLEQACNDGSCPPSRRTDVERLENMALATDVLVGVGLVATALGVTFILSDQETESDGVSASLQLAPGFVQATGRF